MQIDNLVHRYDNKTVLDIPFLEFPQNSIFGLTGPNGAGKTTLISLISNILSVQQGTITKQNTCGLLLQNTSLYSEMTGVQNLDYFCKINNINKNCIKDVLRLVQIDTQTALKKFKSLSQGNKQRLLIARAFLTNAEVILLDEPFNAVDVPTMRLMKEAIKNFSEASKKKNNHLITSSKRNRRLDNSRSNSQ